MRWGPASEGCAVSLVGEVVKCVGFAFVSHGVSGDGVVSAPCSLLKNSDFFFFFFLLYLNEGLILSPKRTGMMSKRQPCLISETLGRLLLPGLKELVSIVFLCSTKISVCSILAFQMKRSYRTADRQIFLYEM